jgi:hypothetical protein
MDGVMHGGVAAAVWAIGEHDGAVLSLLLLVRLTALMRHRREILVPVPALVHRRRAPPPM